MTFDDYQKIAFETAVYAEHGTGSNMALAYGALAVNGECGEIAERIKKLLRGDYPDITPVRDKLHKELGDLLWEMSALATELGFSMDDIAKSNLIKLAGRVEHGTIRGDGNER